MLRNLDKGVPVCLTVTLLDGLVLARSIFNHSMNYRSVVVLGTAVAVLDAREKLEALRLLSEHILPGRWEESRQPNERELKQTLVMRLPIEEFSAKVRQGPPIDDEEDYAFPTWAGVIPLETVAAADQRSAAGSEDARAGLRARVFAQENRILVAGLRILVVCLRSLVLGLWSLVVGQTKKRHGFCMDRASSKNENVIRANGEIHGCFCLANDQRPTAKDVFLRSAGR